MRAVPGMNCATPCAPLKLTALGLKRLSCQISRMKKSAGNSWRAATAASVSHMVSGTGEGAATAVPLVSVPLAAVPLSLPLTAVPLTAVPLLSARVSAWRGSAVCAGAASSASTGDAAATRTANSACLKAGVRTVFAPDTRQQ